MNVRLQQASTTFLCCSNLFISFQYFSLTQGSSSSLLLSPFKLANKLSWWQSERKRKIRNIHGQQKVKRSEMNAESKQVHTPHFWEIGIQAQVNQDVGRPELSAGSKSWRGLPATTQGFVLHGMFMIVYAFLQHVRHFWSFSFCFINFPLCFHVFTWFQIISYVTVWYNL